ncbi:Hypothetical predicted protein [Octopus vulgaris]|uniref:Uncharacterized protein n=1 Tax=Octopus vulgaris TaxID=6645 RepID=A0AA36B343_OCTVU|nr:Hypothetical predicted protein [Octopus vulgaris]
MFEENSTKLIRMSGVQVANSHSKRVTIGDRSGVISKTDSHSKYQKRIFHKTFLSRIVQSKRGETFKQREVKENFEQSRRHHKSNELTNHFPSHDRKNQHIHLPTNFKKFFVNTFTRQASSTQHAHIFDKRVLEPEYSLSSNPKLKTTTVSKNKPNQSNAREIAMVKAFWNRDDDGIHGIAGPTVEFKRNVFQKPMKIQENLVKPIEVERISNKDLEKHVKSKFNLLFDNQKGNMDVLNKRDIASKYSLVTTNRIRKTSASKDRLDQIKRVFSNSNQMNNLSKPEKRKILQVTAKLYDVHQRKRESFYNIRNKPKQLSAKRNTFNELGALGADNSKHSLFERRNKSNAKISKDAKRIKTVNSRRKTRIPKDVSKESRSVFRTDTGNIYDTIVTEEKRFDRLWKAIQHLFPSEWDAGKSSFTMLTFGSLHMTFFAAKIGLLYPQSVVVNVVLQKHAIAMESYRNVLTTNVMMAVNDVDADVVATLYSKASLFKFQVLDQHIFSNVLPLKEQFVNHLGQLLSLAEVSVLELPPFDHFIEVSYLFGIDMFEVHSQKYWIKSFINRAVTSVNGIVQEIVILKTDNFRQPTVLLVKMEYLQREVNFYCNQSKTVFTFNRLIFPLPYLHIGNDKKFQASNRIGLPVLLSLNLKEYERKRLLKNYLSLSVQPDMCPSYIEWDYKGLTYCSWNKENINYNKLFYNELSDIKSTAEVLAKETKLSTDFSFMEYNSKGKIITELATVYKNSTFIAMVQDNLTANNIYKISESKFLDNLAITVNRFDNIYIRKLLKSPEFLRFQYIGYESFLNLVDSYSKQQLNSMLNILISLSISTVILQPSAKILSLAMVTFYPESQWNPYQTKHPDESQDNQTDKSIQVTTTVKGPFYSDTRDLLPWNLVRIDVKHLIRQVDHHFESFRDGHSRKYSLHCNSTNSHHYDVYLQRKTDGFIIPYGDVHTITLITLLRSGLLPKIRHKLYKNFLQLPLYEDMAPWNIVFSAGHLEYIDYDTRNKTYTSFVPLLYQLLALLMNYKRTVADFGQCKGNSRTQFGFGLISDCVASNFSGPCLDSQKPVPCADFTCRSTYIECLKALESRTEKEKDHKQSL